MKERNRFFTLPGISFLHVGSLEPKEPDFGTKGTIFLEPKKPKFRKKQFNEMDKKFFGTTVSSSTALFLRLVKSKG